MATFISPLLTRFGITIETIVMPGEEGEMLSRLQQQLCEKRYPFSPVRQVDRPKPKGGTRPLGINTVADRIVQTAMKIVIEPIFEAGCHDGSYGDRPKRSAKQALIAIREDVYKRSWGVTKSVYPSPHHRFYQRCKFLRTDRRSATRQVF